VKVSVIIPTLNEAGSIKKVIDGIPKETVDEIIVIDGNSNDGTIEIINKLPNVKVIYQEGKGFGNAFKQGVIESVGEIIIFMNGDYSQNPSDIKTLILKLIEGYDIVYASRYIKDAKSYDDTTLRYFGNKFFTLFTNILFNSNFSDILYFFLAFKRESVQNIHFKTNSFDFCVEFLIKSYKNKLKIIDIPSIEQSRYAGISKVNVITHGLLILYRIIALRLSKKL
jgi:glycosyltransferase involved in cell wall biosynthesis